MDVESSMTAEPQSPAQPNSVAQGGPAASMWWTWLLAGAAAMMLYGFTMAPGLLWGDSGEAQLRVLTDSIRGDRALARSHCTYYAAAIAIRNLLNIEAARAANLTAALAGAVTVANFVALVARIATKRATVIAATLALACSHTLWQMSTGAEVITFYTMFLTAELLAVLCYCQSHRGAWLALAALMNGLALSTHNFAMLLWPAYVVMIVMALRHRRLTARWFLFAALSWCVGALPVAILTAVEWRQSGSWSTAIQSLLFGRFQSEVLGVSMSLRSIAQLAVMAVYNIPTPLLILAPIGVIVGRAALPRPFWYFAIVGGVVLFAFVARYNVADQYTFMVPIYLFVAMFLAVGVDRVLQARPSWTVAITVVILAGIGPVVYAVTPALVHRFAAGVIPASASRVPYREPYDWFFQPWRTGYQGARRFADEVFEVLPPNALLIVLDTMRPPLDYLQGSEERRLDVYLSNSHYAWPGRERREVTRENTDALIKQGLLFAASPAKGYISTWLLHDKYEFIPFGPVFRGTLR